MQNLPNKTMILSVDLENKQTQAWETSVIDNLPSSTTATTGVLNAMLRSTAAPIFYPTYQGNIDGWPVANNPALTAIAALKSRESVSLDDIRLMSFGVGRTQSSVGGKTHDWGAVQWFGGQESSTMINPPLLDVIIDQVSALGSDNSSGILGADGYLRVDADLSEVIRIDDTAAIDDLVEQADAVSLTPFVDWINANWS